MSGLGSAIATNWRCGPPPAAPDTASADPLVTEAAPLLMQSPGLLFGKGELHFSVPAGAELTVVEKPPMCPIPIPAAHVSAAVQPLTELARGAKTACILICDITRPVPNGLLLPPIVQALQDSGVTEITVLVATGLHRPNLGDELQQLISQGAVLEPGCHFALPESVSVVNHYARNDEDHVLVGTTTQGTEVLLDKRFVQADLKLVTGLVEPHFMAGWSGGRKVIAPGIAHQRTITTFHSSRFMEHPAARECVLDGNPLHCDQLQIVQMLDCTIHSVSVVINQDRQLCFCSFGDILESHAKAVQFVKPFAQVPVERKFGTVVTSCAGWPLDLTYYQTIKAIATPLDILQPGGNLIVVSNIEEGFGSDEFRQAQQRLVTLGPEEFLKSIMQKKHAAVDEWQTEMLLRALRVGRVMLYSPLMAERVEDVAVSGVQMVHDLDEAIAASVASTGDNHIAVIPEGPYVIPQFVPRE